MKAVIAFGSNLGERRSHIDRALTAIGDKIGKVLVVSSIQETPPMTHPDFEVPDQGPYLNGVALVDTNLPAGLILDELLSIETELGRKRSAGIKWGPRAIDLDIILLEDTVINNSRLTVPHAGMLYRDFVLGPLCEIWPEWEHPIEKRTARQLFEKLASESNVIWKLPRAAGI